jgi:cytochrome c biogenesis protein ResB
LKVLLNYRQLIAKTYKSIAFILIGLFLVSLSGCGLRYILRFNNPEKKAHKQQEKENKKLKKAYQSDVKQQYKMQTKETRRRMNKNLNKVSKDFKRKKGKSRWKCS